VLAVAQDKKLTREEAKLYDVAKQAKLPELPAGRWWWDAGAK
jgi:hypothetical protein